MFSGFRSVVALLPADERRRAAAVTAALLGASLLEVVGVGMVLPFLAVLTGQVGKNWDWLNAIRENWFGGDQKSFVLVATAGFVLVLVIKAGAAFMAGAWSYRFRALASHRLTLRLFTRHMSTRYEYAASVNSAEIINLCRNAAGNVYGGFVQPLMTLVADGVMVVASLGIMLLAEPAASLVAGLLVGVPAVITHKALRRRNQELGRQRELLSTATIKTLQESLAAFKEFSLLGRQQVPVERFAAQDLRYMNAIIDNAVLGLIPKMVLEVSAMVGVLAFFLVAFWSGREPSEILPLLGLMAASVLRMMPAALRVVTAFNTAHFAEASIDNVRRSMAAQHPNLLPPADADMPAPVHWQRLRFDHVGFRYQGGTVDILQDVSFSLGRGRVLGVIGGSGAGKSTLVDLIVGLLVPTAGRILVDDHTLSGDGRAWSRNVGYVSQNVFLIDDSIRRNVAIGIADADIDDERVAKALTAAQMDQFVATLPQGLDTVVGERGAFLSGGQRQRLVLARALYCTPDLLVLDEATSALDQDTEAEILATLAALKGSVSMVVVTHRPSALSLCDEVLRIENGQVTPLTQDA